MIIKDKTQLIWIFLIAIVVLLIVAYGFYEKHRKEKLYQDFRANKPLICGDTVIIKSNGWKIRNNRFLTNGKIMKTIIFCKSSNTH